MEVSDIIIKGIIYMFCKYCGNQIPEEAKYCSKCGKKLSITAESSINHQSSDNILSKWWLLAKTKKLISLITILLLAELGLCCFQIYKVKESSEMLEFFQAEAASAQYLADSYYSKTTEAQERIYGRNHGQAVRDATANQAWEYVNFAEKKLTKNIILLVLYLIVFIVTLIVFIKTMRNFKQN